MLDPFRPADGAARDPSGFSKPEIPTLAEAGVPGIDVTSWYGLLAPRATPQPVINAIFTVTGEILASQGVRQTLEAQGLSVRIEPPLVFADRIRRETTAWRDLIRRRSITANWLPSCADPLSRKFAWIAPLFHR
ncbi:MAG TPA: tripartite tricarboxylate transporter substrate-binding protein [Xanthobacteraceae bacterium]|jgi:tripartite-type tricarboxylate transporter receptor subunit TctC